MELQEFLAELYAIISKKFLCFENNADITWTVFSQKERIHLHNVNTKLFAN